MSNTQLSTIQSQLNSLQNSIDKTHVPIGTILSYSSNNIPAGYFLCNGSQFNASIYPDLYNALGSNTIPDMRGMFLRGLDPNGVADRDGQSRTLLSFQEGTRQFFDYVNHTCGMYSFGQPDGSVTMSNVGVDPITNKNEQHNVSWSNNNGTEMMYASKDNGNQGPGTTGVWDCITAVRPKNVAVNYIIKAYATSSGSDGTVASAPTNSTIISGFTGNTVTQAFRVNSGVGTTSGVGNMQVSFPQAFSGVPYIVAMPTREADYGAGLVPRFVDVNINNNDGTQPNITNTGFLMHVSARGGDTSRPWSVDIIAIGPA